MRKNRKKFAKRVWGMLFVSVLFFQGCAYENHMPEESAENRTAASVADQVLEIGILADVSDPYGVVTYEIFAQEAGKSPEAIVLDLQDVKGGLEDFKNAVTHLQESGLDLLLVDVVEEEGQEALAEYLVSTGIPVFFFGTPPREETLEMTGAAYWGLDEEEAVEYETVLEEKRFDESGYRQKAEKTGKRLYDSVIEYWNCQKTI